MLIASLMLAAQAPAAMPADPLAFDLRCLIVGFVLREQNDPQLREAAEIMSNFYFGRVDARSPDGDLAALMQREIEAMGDADLQPMLQACGRELEQRGNRLSAAGDRLRERGGAPSR